MEIVSYNQGEFAHVITFFFEVNGVLVERKLKVLGLCSNEVARDPNASVAK